MQLSIITVGCPGDLHSVVGLHMHTRGS